MRLGIALKQLTIHENAGMPQAPLFVAYAGSDGTVQSGRPLRAGRWRSPEIPAGETLRPDPPGVLILPPIEVEGSVVRDSLVAWRIEILDDDLFVNLAAIGATVDVTSPLSRMLAGAGASVSGAITELARLAGADPDDDGDSWSGALRYTQLTHFAGMTKTVQTDTLTAEFVIIVTEGDEATEMTT